MENLLTCDWLSPTASCQIFSAELPVVVLWLIGFLGGLTLFSFEELFRRWHSYRRRFQRLTDPLLLEAAQGGEVDISLVNRVGEILSCDKLVEHGWREFNETLVREDTEHGTRVYNTRKAEDFFSEDEIVSGSMNPRFFRAVPGLLTSIGLLATFIAILLGLGEVHYTDKGIEGIQPFINALSAKFAASVIALICAISFTFAETAVLQRAHMAYLKFCQALDSVFPRKTAEDLLVSLKRDAAEQLAAFQHFNTDLSARFRDGVAEGLGPVLQSISKGLTSLTGERDENITVLLERLTQEFRTAMSQSAGVEFQQISATMKEASSLIASANDQTAKLTGSFDKLVSSIDASQRRQEDGSKEQALVMGELLKQMTTSVQQVSNESQSAVDRTVRGLVEQTEAQSQRVNGELQAILKEHRAAAGSVEDMRAAMHQTLELWNKGAREIRQALDPLDTTTKQLSAASASLKSLSRELVAAQEEVRKIFSGTQMELKRLQEMGSANEQLLHEHQRVFNTVQSGLGDVLTTITAKLETLQEVSGRGLSKQLGEFDNHLGMATQKLGAAVDELGEILDDAADNMRRAAS
jgi:hypothetical protein